MSAYIIHLFKSESSSYIKVSMLTLHLINMYKAKLLHWRAHFSMPAWCWRVVTFSVSAVEMAEFN